MLPDLQRNPIRQNWLFHFIATITDANFITVTSKWARWRLKSPASQLFTQPFIRVQIKENIKAPRD